jgi:hypothetical protein
MNNFEENDCGGLFADAKIYWITPFQGTAFLNDRSSFARVSIVYGASDFLTV